MRNVFKNAMLFGTLVDIVIENGKFTYIGKTDFCGTDLGGNRIFPGLIDIHSHGLNGYDVMDGDKLNEMSIFQLEHGTTSWLPTTMTADFDTLKKISEVDIETYKGAQILGFHFEGPYISEEYKGAQNPEFIRPPSLEEFRQLKNAKIVTIAPELPGAIDFIKNCDCIVSIGHTAADYDTTIDAINAGAKCLTHTFNVMPPIHHREPAVIGAAFTKDIYAQVICDGLHVHPAAILMLYKLFGADRMILISDSMRATGLCDGEYDLGSLNVTVKGKEARISNGALAGSVSTLFDCVKNAIKIGIPECDAVKMASKTPANLLGINKGKIKPGYDADFIVVDDEFNLIKTNVGKHN